MPVLIAISPKLAVKEYDLNGTLTVGRHESNDIQLPEDRASRTHCRIRLERGQALLEDLDSANGTFVNGLRVSSQTLKHNDRVTIGATTIIYCEDDSAEKLDDTQVLMESISSQVDAKLVDQALKARAQAIRARRGAGVAAGPVRRAGRRGERHQGLAFVLCFAVVFCAGYLYWHSQRDETDSKNAAANVPASTARTAFVPAPAVKSTRDTDRSPLENSRKLEVAVLPLDEQLKRALAIRDKALLSGNLLGAKATLQAFLAALTPEQLESELGRRAKAELEETAKVSNAALGLTLKQAQEALDAHRFRVVFQRCTNLISNDPNGPFGAKARAILEQIDERTASVAEAAKAKALDAVNRGQLGEARSALESVLGDLSSTRWAGEISTLHLQIIVAGGFLDEVEAARAKKSAVGEAVPLVAAAKKIEGTLVRLEGLTAHLRVGDAGKAELSVSLKAVETKDFMTMLEALELSERHAELGCLWQLLGRKEAAQAASDAALKNPGAAPAAVVLAGLLGHAKNLHVYDFSDWRQQTHWEAVSGSWLTEDGKYVLESREGGETFLKPESMGGPFPLEKARLSFELELTQRSEGWFVLCELGNDTQAALISLENGEATLQDKAGARSPAATLPDAKLSEALRVELRIDGETAVLRLNGRDAATLAIKGISQQKGKLTIQARQCGCAIDNLILRTEE